MAIEKIDIEKFLALAKSYPVFDVRSPGEFIHAHIPNAISLPLFNDEERKIVGTTYKQQSREQAIKVGLDFFGVKMKKMIEDVEEETKLYAKNKNFIPPSGGKGVLIHCWRGGMRSAGVAWLLDLYGFKVYTLVGGYKSFRNGVLKQFEKNYNIKILGGYTGSGKTFVLQELQKSGQPVINLEELANHKGSAFGALGEKPQPTQEMFENLLALELASKASPTGGGLEGAWLEDESQRIGALNIPHPFWNLMRHSSIYFLDIPFEERLKHIISQYGNFDKEKLANAIMRIQKRLGGLETKTAINFLLENNVEGSFRILLTYYDKLYAKGLKNRENFEALLNIIPCESVNVKNAEKLMLQKV